MADDSPASTGAEATTDPAVADVPAAPKPKRVRTGCLTCRERHLKCDEGLPNCLNCKKSGKTCKRGIKLNFHFIDVKDVDLIPRSRDWSVTFQDESRLIASEYQGGIQQYSRIPIGDPTITPPHEPSSLEPYNMNIDPSMAMQQNLPSILQRNAPGLYPESRQHEYAQSHTQSHSSHSLAHSRDTSLHHSQHSSSNVSYLPTAPPTLYEQQQRVLTPPSDSRDVLSTPHEVLFMQVFVEEVGLWMDSMDSHKHFSRLLPFQSPSNPMILNAFLACGARHLCLMDPVTYKETEALAYYDTATNMLMQCLHDPDRDMQICAVVATILNVYEIMTERASHRMNHIAGARALIKECHWNAKSMGVGAACFWLNVGMEVLSCLHFNWQTAWDPDHWGVNMSFLDEDYVDGADSPVAEPAGRNEELWVHRILYLTAKICNFRATIPRFREKDRRDEEARTRRRVDEWDYLRASCERWEQACPRTMKPLGVIWPGQSVGPGARKSLFPEIWLLKRASITARLFWHTCMILLSTTHPLYPFTQPASGHSYSYSSNPQSSTELASMCIFHAHQTCGIVTHVKDRGVASVSLRSIAVAAEVLQDRGEQEEVMQTLKRIRRDTGWNITFMEKELPEHWGWNKKHEDVSAINNFFQQGTIGGQHNSGPGTPRALKAGMVNPLLAKADFSLPVHPYQQWYQPPNQRVESGMSGMGSGMGGMGGGGSMNMGGGSMGGMGGGNVHTGGMGSHAGGMGSMGGGSGMANGGFGPQFYGQQGYE